MLSLCSFYVNETQLTGKTLWLKYWIIILESAEIKVVTIGLQSQNQEIKWR